MRKSGVFTAIVAILFVAYALTRPSTKSIPTEPSSPPTAVAEVSPVPVATPSPTVKAEPQKSVVDSVPKLETVRKEIDENPHITPKSQIEFAMSMAPKMEAAMKSPEKANALITELEDCLNSPRTNVSHTDRAYCLSNIHRLGEKVPAVRARAANIEEKADPAIVRLSK